MKRGKWRVATVFPHKKNKILSYGVKAAHEFLTFKMISGSSPSRKTTKKNVTYIRIFVTFFIYTHSKNQNC